MESKGTIKFSQNWTLTVLLSETTYDFIVTIWVDFYNPQQLKKVKLISSMETVSIACLNSIGWNQNA